MGIYQILALSLVIKCLSCQSPCRDTITVIDVSQKFESCSNELHNHYKCPDIEKAIEYMSTYGNGLNDTCMQLYDDQYLSTLLTISYVSNFVVTSHDHVKKAVHITCRRESGLVFEKSSKIYLHGLHFNDCGTQSVYQSTSTSANLIISTALFFYRVKTLNITDVTFVSSRGYSIVLKHVYGNLTFNKVNVYNGTSHTNLFKGKMNSFSGGGILLEYRNAKATELYAGCNVEFYCCQFLNNNAMPTNKVASDSPLPFGKGGGLTILASGQSQGNSILVRNCTFENNKAVWGGGIYIDLLDKNSKLKIIIDGTRFFKNVANFSGGGLILSSHQLKYDGNAAKITNCDFVQNTVKSGDGGGLTMRFLSHKIHSKKDGLLENCTFDKNLAVIGSGIHLQNTNIQLIDLLLRGRKGTTLPVLQNISHNKAGGLYAFRSRLVISGNSNFVSNNKFTGFVLDASSLTVHGQLDFISNKGYNGGAISLFGHSNIILNRTSTLNLRHNFAYKNGGGIYLSIPNSISLPMKVNFHMYPCFLLFQNGVSNFIGKVIFDNNTCWNSGSDIFSSTLRNCAHDLSIIKKRKRNFVFSNNQTVNTNAIRITSIRNDWKVWPGKIFKPHIFLNDEMDNNVSEAIDVSISSYNNSVQIESGNRRFLVRNNQITLKLLVENTEVHKYEIEFNITVSLARDGYIKHKIVNLKILPCLLGFTFISDQCVCNVQKNEVRGIAACYDDKPYILHGRWAMPNQKALATDSEITQVCPPNYCRKKCPNDITDLACPYEPEKFNQCAENRDQKSLLCSKCISNYSVAIGSEQCMNCTSASAKLNFLWIIPTMLLVIGFIVWIIIKLNVDIYHYYLNGFFYYYQVSPLLIPSNFKYWRGLNRFVSIVNLNGVGDGAGICLWNGLNDLDKMMFNYFIPGSMIMILIVFSVLYNYWKPNATSGGKYGQDNCIHAFIVISVWAYSDITRITFLLLKPDTINEIERVHIYADVVYKSPEHLKYFIPACIVLLMVVAFPFMLTFSSWLIGFDSFFYKFNNPFARWISVFDAFKDSFKEDRQLFASYYFFCRLLLLGISTFSDKTLLESVALAILCLLICLIFQIFLPYKANHFWTNIYDVIALSDLAAVSILSLAVGTVRGNQEKKLFMDIINGLMLIPLILVMIRISYLLYIKDKSQVISYLLYIKNKFQGISNLLVSKNKFQGISNLLVSKNKFQDMHDDDDDDDDERSKLLINPNEEMPPGGLEPITEE